MIKPTKYLDLDSCVINVAAAALKELSVGPLRYDELLRRIESSLSDRARFVFSYALGLCYLMRLVDYDDAADVLFRTAPGKTAGV